MGVIGDLLKDVPIPRMVLVGQKFPDNVISNVEELLRAELHQPEVLYRIKPGARIAVCVGSRGMAQIPILVKVVVDEIKKRNGKPFIVPAMGSHGGATAKGQIDVLASLGVTEASVGCPVISSMEVVKIGCLNNGLDVLVDKNAYEADGIVLINRIKAHNAFSGPNESGIAKMLTIGLGKQKGADSCHRWGFKYMPKFIVEMAKIKIDKLPVLFGIGTIENAYDHISKIKVLLAENIIEDERKLLCEAKKQMPKLLLKPLDVLLVDYMGKEFSGGGMDPYTTGRPPTPYVQCGLSPTRMVVFDLTNRSHGNACGVGLADITTKRLFKKVDFDFTYANLLTSTVVTSARIPMMMESDELAIKAAVKTSGISNWNDIRMVRIANTLNIKKILVSEALLPEVKDNPQLEILGLPTSISFDIERNIVDLGKWI